MSIVSAHYTRGHHKSSRNEQVTDKTVRDISIMQTVRRNILTCFKISYGIYNFCTFKQFNLLL
jgi:hypothetical protein